MAWTDLSAYAAGRFTVAMAELLRGNFKAIGDAWGTYTPTWTASTANPTLGNGTLSGRYMQAGKLVLGSVDLVFGSTTTLGTGNYAWTLPVNAQNFRYVQGNCEMFDASAGTIFPRCILPTNANSFAVADFTPTRLSSTGPIAWATGDRISVGFTYEAA